VNCSRCWAERGLASLTLDRIQVTARASSPNEKLNIAVIGRGGQGAANLNRASGENIAAPCDVDADF
jgi:hypothetical protein